jgi:hypothetical protein
VPAKNAFDKWSARHEPLSQRLRRPLCLLVADDELLMPVCRDPDAILAERSRLDVALRCLDP